MEEAHCFRRYLYTRILYIDVVIFFFVLNNTNLNNLIFLFVLDKKSLKRIHIHTMLIFYTMLYACIFETKL